MKKAYIIWFQRFKKGLQSHRCKLLFCRSLTTTCLWLKALHNRVFFYIPIFCQLNIAFLNNYYDRYRSNFASNAKQEYRTKKQSSKTMVRFLVEISLNQSRIFCFLMDWHFFVSLQGPPKVALTEPKDFLGKHSKEFKLPESMWRCSSFMQWSYLLAIFFGSIVSLTAEYPATWVNLSLHMSRSLKIYAQVESGTIVAGYSAVAPK